MKAEYGCHGRLIYAVEGILYHARWTCAIKRYFLSQEALCSKRWVYAVGGDLVVVGGRICVATDNGRHRALDQIELLSMHDALAAENFVPPEANIDLDRTCGLMWVLRLFCCQFLDEHACWPFADMACRELWILYKEHIYGCLMGLSASVCV